MVDIETYRARIGCAPGINEKIRQRRVSEVKDCKSEEWDDEILWWVTMVFLLYWEREFGFMLFNAYFSFQETGVSHLVCMVFGCCHRGGEL